MKKTSMYYITIILTTLLIFISTYSYAAEITKETLKEFFDIFNDKKTGTIQVTDNKIMGFVETGIVETTKIDIEYNLKDKPTFKTIALFENEMTHEECVDEASKFVTLGYAFAAICNKMCDDVIEANEYFSAKIFQNSSVIEYTTKNVVLKEDFTNAKDYIEKRFAKDIIVDDELFSLTVKKEDIGNDVYNVVSQLVVHTDKDFSVIEKMRGDNEIIKNTAISVTPTPLQTKTPSTANIGTMPNAGFEINALNILKVVLGLSISALMVYGIYNKKYSSK